MPGRSPKAKGDNYEREVAAYLNSTVFDGREVCYRAPLSGGGRNFLGGGAADLTGTPTIHAECKRTEKFSPYAAMEQAEKGLTGRACPDMPVVFTRRNRIPTGDSLVVMRLDDWAKFYAAYLAQNP